MLIDLDGMEPQEFFTNCVPPSGFVGEGLVEEFGGAGDAEELAVVEPIEIAEIAGVEYHVARPCVEVGLHRAAAVRAGNVAAEIFRVGCSADGDAVTKGSPRN